MANPYMVKGHKINVGRTRKEKRSLTLMLEQFTPRVLEIIEHRLTRGDEVDQWVTTKELLPYLFIKRVAAVPSPAPAGETPDLKQYLLERVRHGIDKAQPA
jgi:hypothetical protein